MGGRGGGEGGGGRRGLKAYMYAVPHLRSGCRLTLGSLSGEKERFTLVHVKVRN